MTIIDLSQEIYDSMPVYHAVPQVSMKVHATHEQWAGEENATTSTPAAYHLSMSEHTGTHVDALNHMGKPYIGQSIDTMPLSMFYTEGICLNFSHKKPLQIIEKEELIAACESENLEIKKGDTVLIYTDHYRKTFNSEDWKNNPGLSAEATRWLGEQGISAFGVESISPGVQKVSNREVHAICGEMGFTHYENLINLHLLIGRGRFRFIGFPLKIRGGTGSPVRAVAVFE